MKRLPISAALLLCTFAVGCSTTQSWSGLTSRFSRNRADQDALVLEEEALSEGFQKSQGGLTEKGLKNPEATNLAFARWKEDMDQFAEAKRRYHEILTANPDCLPARLGIARIERETGRYTQCREILEAARRQHPENPAVALEMGRMYNDRQEWRHAVTAFRQATDLAPDDQTIRYELGLALTNAGMVDEGLPHLRFAVGDSAACYNVAYLLNERGKTADAVNWVERALDSHPDERTRKMAGELLADMRVQNPSLRNGGQPPAGDPAWREEFVEPQIIAGSPAGQQPVNTMRPAHTPAPAQQSTWSARTAEPTVPAGYHVATATATVREPAGSSTPPQWSGPGMVQQTPQSQWSRSSRSTVPTRTVGYTQPQSQPTEPPAWR